MKDGIAAPGSPVGDLDPPAYALLDNVYVKLSYGGGPAPGLAGVYQFNLQIPSTAREGCAVPLVITLGQNYPSQPVTIGIHNGGGQCVDPPSAANGQVTLSKVISSGTSADGEADSLQASFTSSPGRAATAGVSALYPVLFENPSLPAPACPIPGYRQLNAGTLALQSPNASPAVVAPAGPADQTSYAATLPSGTLQPGVFTISATSQSQVGAFSASLPFGNDIQITTPAPAPGSTWDVATAGAITFKWTGGDPSSLVTVYLIAHLPLFDYVNFCSAPASAGQCMPYYITYMRTETTTIIPSPNGELVYQIVPGSPTTFSAPGLTAGGQFTWQIQHRFAGFAISTQ